MSDFSDSDTRTARKRHNCLYCMEWIEAGELHHRQGGKWEGEWQDWRMHLDCLQAHYRESQDNPGGYGEVCQDDHERGRTCNESEDLRFKFKDELAQTIKGLQEKGESAGEIAHIVLGDVEEWQEEEARRLKGLKKLKGVFPAEKAKVTT